MKNIKKIIIINLSLVIILTVFVAPKISLAVCLDSGECSTIAEVKKTPIPNCTGNNDPTPCCQQNSNLDKGLVQCGRRSICEYQITAVTDSGNTATFTSYKENKNIIIKSADPKNACNFNSVMALVNSIIRFILIDLAIPIAGIMFVYAGFLLVTSGGDTGARTKAKDIFLNAAIGLIIAFTAYLLVMYVLKLLGYNGSWIGF